MRSVAPGGTPDGGEQQAAAAVDRLVREALVGTLASIDRDTGHPYASLVEVATSADGRPILLLSGLARHTRNIAADPRASLLVDRRGAGGALALERATLIGAMAPTGSSWAGARYLRRHPPAAAYAGFGDFAFWVLEPAQAHFIGGFGRIREVAPSLGRRPADAADAALAAVEAARIDAVAARLGDGIAGWRLAGLDDAGADLVHAAGPAAGRRIAIESITADGFDADAVAATIRSALAQAGSGP